MPPRRSTDRQPPDGWQSWGQHVLVELERLSQAVESLREQVADMKQDSRVAQHSAELDDLKTWRRDHDNVATPVQLAKLVEKVDRHEATQIKAYTVMAVGQVLLTALGGVILWWLQKRG